LGLASPGGAGRNKTLGQNEFAKLDVMLPTLSEQEKIVAFIGSVDMKLEALRRQCELLQSYKRGLVQKIFSLELHLQTNDAVPDWKEIRLGEIIKIKYGKDHKELADGKIPVYGTGGIMRHVNKALSKGPSVLIGRKGTINRPIFVTEPFWTVDTLFYSEIYEGYVPYFVFQLVKQINWLKYNEATGVPSLNTSSINGVKVKIPIKREEQQKIADFLSAIDARIDAVADQIEKMKQFKKGLLQQMFV
jgi:type I restriction enzyme S subunit